MMSPLTFPFIAFAAGAAIATQASLNAQLGVLMKSSLIASAVAFFSSFLFTMIALLFVLKKLPSLESIQSVPFYLWFSGGLLSTFAIAAFYWLIPQMGVGSLVSYALAGQLVLATVAAHFGWFQLPIAPLSLLKTIGVFSLLFGIVLVNKG